MDMVHTSQLVGSAIAIVLNSILLIIIVTKSGKHIGTYKYLLLSYTIVQLFSSLFINLGLQGYLVTEYGVLLYATAEYFPRYIQTFIIFGFTVCLLLLSFVLGLSYLYRYFIFCRPEKLKWLEEPKRVGVILLIVCLTTIEYEWFLVYHFHPSEELDGMFPIPGKNMTSIGYMAMPITNKSGMLQIPTIIAVITWAGTIILCVIGVVYVTAKMIYTFRETIRITTMSKHLLKVQRRLFMLLILQTAVPSFFNFVPIVILYLLPYSGVQLPLLRDVTPMLIPIAQVFDPLLIIFFIPDYYNVILQLINLVLCKKVKFSIKVTTTTAMDRTATYI